MKIHMPVRSLGTPWLYLLVPVLAMVLWVYTFLSTGYSYTPEYGKDYIGGDSSQYIGSSSGTTSPECQAEQKKAKKQIAPLQKEYNKYASRLINGSLPVEDGEALYKKAVALEVRINNIQIKYRCE